MRFGRITTDRGDLRAVIAWLSVGLSTIKYTVAFVFFLGLAGCSSVSTVPVESLNTGSATPVVPFGSISSREMVYRVKRGDTLSDIAWRYRTSVSQIATRNGLQPPYSIYPDQKLVIKKTNNVRSSKTKKVIKTPFKRRLDDSGYRSNNNHNKQFQPRAGNLSNNKVLIDLQWPARGEVVTRFQEGRPPREGIEIAARHGDPVYAAADGVVVYVGEGLRGLGKTVILLHDNQFLTAYSNNRKTRVRYEQSVKQGQIIAEVGATAEERSKLHFQVRSSGRPVDPLRYLPLKD